LRCASGKFAIGIENVLLRTLSVSGVVGVNASRGATPSMKRNTAVEKPPINRLALVAIASNTGYKSDGELAMTFRMSAVAVATAVSINSLTSIRQIIVSCRFYLRFSFPG
jgi:hypothetical protein